MSIQSECKVAREAMKALLLDGVEPCASHLAHLKECPSCRAIGEQALSLLSTDENPPTTPTPSLPELKAEVRHQAWRRLAIRAAMTLGVSIAFLGVWALVSCKSLVEFGGIAFVILAASVIP
ncbi:MAG: hypothetical protein Q8O00_06765, partial [Holophaga sp.]|nr:hypothetical protein [Holophaga sp.]